MKNDKSQEEYEEYLERLKKNEQLALDLKTANNARTFKRAYNKTGRNHPCPCGSGKKYKHCHMGEAERKYVIVS